MPVYKDKSTNTYYCKFYYTDYTGTRRQKLKRGFVLQRDAKAWENAFLSSQTFDNKTTFGAVASLFEKEMTPKLRVTTMRGYMSRLPHINNTFADVPLCEITEQKINAWQNSLLNSGLAPGTCRSTEKTFRTIYRYGARRCNITSDPFRSVPIVGKVQRSLNYWTIDEFNAVCAHLSPFPEHRVAITTLFYTGLRIGELLALKREDLDGDILHITKSLQRIKKQDIITPPKTEKGIRDIYLPELLIKELQEHISRLQPGIDRLFNLDKTSYRYAMNKAADAAGIKRIRLHDLRHSHAALLISEGVPPVVIAERLGHESINTTLRVYGHLYPSKQKEIATLLDAISKK